MTGGAKLSKKFKHVQYHVQYCCLSTLLLSSNMLYSYSILEIRDENAYISIARTAISNSGIPLNVFSAWQTPPRLLCLSTYPNHITFTPMHKNTQ